MADAGVVEVSRIVCERRREGRMKEPERYTPATFFFNPWSVQFSVCASS